MKPFDHTNCFHCRISFALGEKTICVCLVESHHKTIQIKHLLSEVGKYQSYILPYHIDCYKEISGEDDFLSLFSEAKEE